MTPHAAASSFVNSSSESFKVGLYKTFEEAMTPAIIEKYNAKTTGGKYILNPNKG